MVKSSAFDDVTACSFQQIFSNMYRLKWDMVAMHAVYRKRKS